MFKVFQKIKDTKNLIVYKLDLIIENQNLINKKIEVNNVAIAALKKELALLKEESESIKTCVKEQLDNSNCLLEASLQTIKIIQRQRQEEIENIEKQ